MKDAVIASELAGKRRRKPLGLRIAVPSELTANATRLLWHARGLQHPRSVPVAPDVLERFRALYLAPDSRIAEFAQHYGPLGLTSRGVPLSGSAASEREYFATHEGDALLFVEEFAQWRIYSNAADAVVLAGAQLAIGALPSEETLSRFLFERPEFPGEPYPWRTLGDGVFLPPLEARPLTKHQKIWVARSIVRAEVNCWLRYGSVQAHFEETEGVWKLGTRTAGLLELFGVIATRLAEALVNAVPLVVCDGCGRAFRPEKRAPKSGQRSWCPNCKRDGTMERARKRLQRERKRDAQESR